MRIVLLIIALVAVIIALDENSIIFTIVSFAWAGFGATFGPIMLFSLFWKRTTYSGAIASIVAGAVVDILWFVTPIGAITGIYELLPGFVVAFIVCVVVSLLSKAPSDEVIAIYEKATQNEIDD